MAINNPNPTTSVSDNYSKYAEYFVEDKSNTNLSIETFFTLLMAEMSNQDPLEPTSNTEFLAQLANFTALQNSSNTLYYNTVTYASSLAGKTVTVATSKPGRDGGLDIQTGVVTGVDISDGTNIEITVNGKRYKLSNVMNVAETASGNYSNGSDGAYAVSLIGKKVTLVAEAADGTLLEQGIVESIEVENGEYRVVVNGYSYALSDIIKVNNADENIAVGQGSGTSSKEEPKEDDTAETESQSYSDMLYINTVSYATSLTGKTVTVSVYDAAAGQMKTLSGTVSEVDISDRTNIGIYIGGQRYSLGAVTGVAETVSGSSFNSFSSDGAFAVSLIGNEVSVLTQQGYSITGVVESITMADGQYQVVINGIGYPLSGVTTVNGKYINPDKETPESDGTDNADEVTDTEEN